MIPNDSQAKAGTDENRGGIRSSEDDFQHLIEKPEASSILAIKKDLIFLIGFVLILFIAYHSPLKQYLDKAPEICERIKQTGSIFAPVIFTLGVCVLVCAGVPRLLLCPIGGMAFGFFFGLAYCVLGTLMASYIIFLFVRWGGRDFVLRHSHSLSKLTRELRHGGIPAVILVRQMPVFGIVADLILGLSPIRHRDFLIGTFIGLIPEAIPFTLIGKGAKQETVWQNMIYIMLAIMATATIWLVVKFYSRRNKNSA